MMSLERSTNASPRSVMNTSRTFVSAGTAETSGGAPAICASMMARACSTTVAPNGTSRCAGTSAIPSSLT